MKSRQLPCAHLSSNRHLNAVLHAANLRCSTEGIRASEGGSRSRLNHRKHKLEICATNQVPICSFSVVHRSLANWCRTPNPEEPNAGVLDAPKAGVLDAPKAWWNMHKLSNTRRIYCAKTFRCHQYFSHRLGSAKKSRTRSCSKWR